MKKPWVISGGIFENNNIDSKHRELERILSSENFWKDKTKVKKTVLGPDGGNFSVTVDPPASMSKDVPWLTPYWGLYGVQPTGFQYIMPYFVDEYMDELSASIDGTSLTLSFVDDTATVNGS